MLTNHSTYFMKRDKLLKILNSLGLSENEAKVYLAAMSLGPTTILQISRAAQIKRTTVYSVIESLKQKGLITIEFKGWKKKFVAADPSKLEAIIEQKRQDLINSLPEFTSLYNLKESEGIFKYYEGLEAVKIIYEDLLKEVKAHDYYLVVANQEKWLELDKKFFINFIKKRAKLNLDTRLLFEDSKIAKEHKAKEQIFNQQVKILPKKTKINIDLIITPQKIVIHQLIPPIMAIVIENKSIIQMQKEFFEIMWKAIK